ncbi:MAG: DUF2520 domain-containing protein [Deltaproteobacteria bacterium]|jgi:predicted short-subunit dehydrogenase-like oxidoreductase (DUF2520 family)|nr:DUF2520 domain-containing protein [Deltaproteobacteria bacterium]
MSIGFVGAGKVGCSFGKYLSLNGVGLSGYHSESSASAAFAAEFTGSGAFEDAAALVGASDLVILSVPDDRLEGVWEKLKRGDIAGKAFFHTSGSRTSDLFSGANEKGARGASVHPLMAIPDKLDSHRLLRGAFFTLEGDPAATVPLKEILTRLGNVVCDIDKSQKVLYHCAASVVSNFSVALARFGAEIFESVGLSRAADGLFGLMKNNAVSVASLGPVKALTGPIERGDLGTVKAHLSVLSGEDKILYGLLAKKLAKVAGLKHPDRDYGAMTRFLEEETEKSRAADAPGDPAGPPAGSPGD